MCRIGPVGNMLQHCITNTFRMLISSNPLLKLNKFKTNK